MKQMMLPLEFTEIFTVPGGLPVPETDMVLVPSKYG
jgi:hypothetical protein